MPAYDRPVRQGAVSNRRGRAANDRQLGRVQVKILRWLLGEEVRLGLGGDDSQRRMLARQGVPWKKVADEIDERPSAVSAALRGGGQRSLVARNLVVLSMSRGGRVTHVKLTALGRATAESTAPDRSPRAMKDSVRRRFVELHGPRSGWSADVKLDEKEAVEDALQGVSIESLRLGRQEKHLSAEEFGAILDATNNECAAVAPNRSLSSAHFESVLTRRIIEYVRQRDGEG